MVAKWIVVMAFDFEAFHGILSGIVQVFNNVYAMHTRGKNYAHENLQMHTNIELSFFMI